MGSRLRNKVAIVTGGGAGIGEAISKRFAQEGAKVVVCGLPDDPVVEVANQIRSYGGMAIPFQGDISQAPNAKACVDLAIETYGKLDILINNAGVFPAVGTIDEYPIDALEYLLQNNVQSAFMMTKFAIPYLQKSKGCVVSAGSEAGIDGDAENAPYAGTKGFIHAFSRSLAVEQAQYGVRVNVVCPGPIDTSWTHHETSPMTTKMEKQFISATPMGRRGTPEEVANVYLFLASDEASYVTGALYPVDGGITVSKGPAGLMADSSMKKAPEGQLDLHYSQEGDPVRRPFQSLEEESDAEDTRSSGGTPTVLRNALVGLSLAAVAFGVATRFWDKSAPDASRDAGATPQTGPLAQTSGRATTQTSGQGFPASDSVGNVISADRTGPANDLDNGFTNEAATGNND